MPALVIFIVIIGIVGVISLADVLTRKRREAFQSAAQVLGYAYTEKNNSVYYAIEDKFELFSRGHRKKAFNVLEGQSCEASVVIFDYRYTVGHGKRANTHDQTVIAVKSNKLQLPQFELRPEHLFHKIGSKFGYQDIDFENFPAFSKKYLLRGENEQAVRTLFRNEVIAYFENHLKLNFEGNGDTFIYIKARPEPDELPAIMQEVMQVYGFFRR